MWIDHHDMPFGRLFANPVQNQRGGRRFAGTGGTEQREMLAEHGIDIQRAANIGGGKDRADLDIGARIGGIDLLDVLRGDGIDLRSRYGIAGDAAAELVDPPGQLFFLALAQKIDLTDDRPLIIAAQLLRADIGEQPAVVDADFHLAADLSGHGQAAVIAGRQRPQLLGIEQDRGGRSIDFRHIADRDVGAGPHGWCSARLFQCIGVQDRPANFLRFLEILSAHVHARHPLLLLAILRDRPGV